MAQLKKLEFPEADSASTKRTRKLSQQSARGSKPLMKAE
jgi:hypothetical protein